MRSAKKDDNQDEIVEALRKAGCSVAITSHAHSGFPDIVVGFRGVNYLIEIKDGNKYPSQQKLTEAQVKFHDTWFGQISVANSVEQALKAVGISGKT